MSAAGDKKKTACVTGGNGYIASALIKMLLEKGYAVKTTVRNPGSVLPSVLSSVFHVLIQFQPGRQRHRSTTRIPTILLLIRCLNNLISDIISKLYWIVNHPTHVENWP